MILHQLDAMDRRAADMDSALEDLREEINQTQRRVEGYSQVVQRLANYVVELLPVLATAQGKPLDADDSEILAIAATLAKKTWG